MPNEPRRKRFLRLPRRTTQRIEAEIDHEFEFHLAMRTRELEAAGLSAGAARLEALRQFGDLGDARAYCRDVDVSAERRGRRSTWLAEVRQDVRLAARQMRRSPRFAVGAMLTLAIGVAVATAAYSLMHAYLVRPLPYPEADRLAFVIAGPTRQPFANAPSLRDVDWSPADAIFDGTVAWDLDGFTLAGGDRPEYVDGAWVSAGYFAALGVRAVHGRGFRREEYSSGGAPAAMISDALWARRYNRDASIVGATIRAHSTDRPNDPELVTIVGVMPADAWHITRFTDVIRPLTTPRMPSIVRLKTGTSLEQAAAQLNAAVLPQLGGVDSAWKMTLASVQDEYTFAIRPTLLALFGGAAFMLLIAVASVAGAMVARAAGRRSELAIRGALGAARGRLVRQLLTEILVLAALAAAAGTLLARMLMNVLRGVVGQQLGVSVPGGDSQLIPGAITFAGVIVVGTALGALFGLVPALLATRGDVAPALRSARGFIGDTRRSFVRHGLMVAQVALTVVLLAGAGLMTRTVLALRAAPLGFEPSNVLKADVLLPLSRYRDAASRRGVAERMLAAVSALPGVEAAAFAFPYPFRQTGAIAVTSEPGPLSGAAAPRAVAHTVSTAYFDAVGVVMLGGRTFDARDHADAQHVAIVSDGLARQLWPDGSAIGRRIRIAESGDWRTVVGVARETLKTVVGERLADVYVPYAQAPRAYTSIVVRTASAAALSAADLQRSVARVDDVLALADVEPLDDVVAREGARRRVLATLLGAFSLFALGLALLGLYSSLSYVVAQRRRELAVRMAIGAGAGTILRLVLGEGLRVILAGAAIGIALSVALSRGIASQLYGVAATDVPTFAAAVTLLMLAGLAAIASPAWRAIRVDPACAMQPD